ncbi:hypothetical protein JKP88DRAFT_223243 [Tribonema minus]|uniref:Uncharacterized protein n=1 Tax=Tribonema minus TaxID=303371 RepID=A0A836CCF7_9STRA|nr:hypothetical protein JKP88DRAFT_223243 [Tribonema minus]
MRSSVCAACYALALLQQQAAAFCVPPRGQGVIGRSSRACRPSRVFMSSETATAATNKFSAAPEADPIPFVRLLGQLTPSPAEDASPEMEAQMVAEAVNQNLDKVLDGPFLRWLQKKVALSETMGNQSAHATLRTLEGSIATAIKAKLRAATELVTALLGTDCSGARGQLLREILILPGGQEHPLYLAPDDPKRQFGDAAVDPYDFKRAWDILAEGQRLQGVWEDTAETPGTHAMMDTVLAECARVLNGQADVKSDEEVSSCSSKI